MSSQQEQDADDYERLFFPYATHRFEEAQRSEVRFAHYTSAYAATQIIEKKTVWMRSAALMNDFSEVKHGRACLAAAWKDECVG